MRHDEAVKILCPLFKQMYLDEDLVITEVIGDAYREAVGGHATMKLVGDKEKIVLK